MYNMSVTPCAQGHSFVHRGVEVCVRVCVCVSGELYIYKYLMCMCGEP